MNAIAIPWHEYFASVGDVWLIWALCLVAMLVLVRRAYGVRNWSGLRSFHSDECGSSYALSYVMTFPIYLFLMCLIIQSTLILMVKVGTVYSAYAAARSVIVWRPSQPDRPISSERRLADTHAKAQRAAALAMTPFASGFSHHLDRMYTFGRMKTGEAILYDTIYRSNATYNANADKDDELYFLRKHRMDLAGTSYVQNKYMFAAASTSVDFKSEIPAWNENSTVQVTYSMPMHVPAVGRIFGDRANGGNYYARDIFSTATMPSEAAETVSKRIGIPYDPMFVPDRWF